MSSVVVAPGQTFTDLAIQYLGSAEAAFGLAAANGQPVTAVLAAGDVVELTEVADEQAVQFFTTLTHDPAASIYDDVEPEGIGFWTIGEDFIVS